MTPLETDAIARRINRANARRSARAEAAAREMSPLSRMTAPWLD